jgi:hypothetical protein
MNSWDGVPLWRKVLSVIVLPIFGILVALGLMAKGEKEDGNSGEW